MLLSEHDYAKRNTRVYEDNKTTTKKGKTLYLQSDLWGPREHAIFLKYCTNIWDR